MFALRILSYVAEFSLTMPGLTMEKMDGFLNMYCRPYTGIVAKVQVTVTNFKYTNDDLEAVVHTLTVDLKLSYTTEVALSWDVNAGHGRYCSVRGSCGGRQICPSGEVCLLDLTQDSRYAKHTCMVKSKKLLESGDYQIDAAASDNFGAVCGDQALCAPPDGYCGPLANHLVCRKGYTCAPINPTGSSVSVPGLGAQSHRCAPTMSFKARGGGVA